MKKLIFLYILSSAGLLNAEVADKKVGTLSLDIEKSEFGNISPFEDRKNYLIRVEQEKKKILGYTLVGFYEKAYAYYKEGDYRRAEEFANKILSIDPKFEKAHELINLIRQKKEEENVAYDQARIEDKFSEGLALYNEGRITDAMVKWEEMSRLSMGSEKTGFWLKRSQSKASEQLVKRGKLAYEEKRFKNALDHWYAAVLLNRDDPQLFAMITSAEKKYRAQQANLYLKRALTYYKKGKFSLSIKNIRSALGVQPGDARAYKLIKMIRRAIAKKYVASGKKFYSLRKYNSAIASWNKAKLYGYNEGYVNKLISRTKRQMKLEAAEKKRKEKERKIKAAEAAEKARQKEEEEKKKKIQEELAAEASKDGKPYISEERKRSAREFYIKGVKHLSKREFYEAEIALKTVLDYDPNHTEAQIGLKRIEQMRNVAAP